MMSERRFDQIFQGMTGVAKKVYSVIPIAEPWTTNQIAAEIVRLGLSIDFSIMVGCINTLIKAKLVQEPVQRTFIRTPIRMRAVQEMVAAAGSFNETEEDEPMPAAPQSIAKPKASPVNRLGDIASRLRRMGTEFNAELNKLAGDVENAAIESADEIKALEASLDRFKQLKTLLKDLT